MQIETGFIEKVLPEIEGWLNNDAAYFTAYLIRSQLNINVCGPVLEIGVWRGKYLALLHQEASEKVVGVDSFQFGFGSREVIDDFRKRFGEAHRVQLLEANSKEITKADLFDVTGGKPFVFTSVDGSHRADDVFKDIGLAVETMQENGIIALDDFLNRRAIGVSEGCYRFFFSEHGAALCPFAHCGNKLFVCHPKHWSFYRQCTLQFIADNQELPVSKAFQDFQKKGSQWVDFDLLGVKCLVLG